MKEFAEKMRLSAENQKDGATTTNSFNGTEELEQTRRILPKTKIKSCKGGMKMKIKVLPVFLNAADAIKMAPLIRH